MTTAEKKIDLAEVSAFNKGKLNHAETNERQHMPDAAELAHDKTLKGIKDFPGDGLKKTETVEKNTLPTKEDIESEKKTDF